MVLDWNFFGAACILAAHFATLQDAHAMDETVLQDTWLSVLLGSGIVTGVHVVCYLLRTCTHPLMRLWHLCHTSLSFVTEMSIFLILCQNIGMRGPQEYTIPVEYAYIPFLIVAFIYSMRILPCQNSSVQQGMSMLAFVLIVCLSWEPNMSYPGDAGVLLPLFMLLVSIYAVPEEGVTSVWQQVVFSAVGKCIVLGVAIACMNAATRPASEGFHRLHDFYLIRAVSHLDPQFTGSHLTPLDHVLSIKGLVGHIIKLVYLGTSCSWFAKSAHSLV
jgi:hypothetical protein